MGKLFARPGPRPPHGAVRTLQLPGKTAVVHQGRGTYTGRGKSETVQSMTKRNFGSALSGKAAWSRKRDMALKALTHNVMFL
jgi:hypothetical protein